MHNFIAIVEAGSISAAARRLGVGQPAVSKSLAALESYLGTVLLVRSTRGSALTDAGQRYLTRARAVLEEADAADADARNEAANLTGPLRIAAPPAYASEVILPHLSEFLVSHPGITLDFVLDDRRVDLVGEGIDLALRGGAMRDSAIVARRVDRPARIVVAGASYLKERDTPRHPRELLAHDWIDYSVWSGTQWEFCNGAMRETINLTPRLTISAAEGLRTAILSGLGCAIVSVRMVQRELGTKGLVQLMPDWTIPPGEFWLCSPAGRRMNARAEAFSNWLEGLIASLPSA